MASSYQNSSIASKFCKMMVALILALVCLHGLDPEASTSKILLVSANGHGSHSLSHGIAKAHKKHGTKGTKGQMSGDSYSSAYSRVFDVLSYGAVGDGHVDDSKAFLAAWLEACQVNSAVFEVPRYFTFLVHPVLFSGPCAPNIIFQVDGVMVAPTNPRKWGQLANSQSLEWIGFYDVHDMVITGDGIFDGSGTSWPSTSISTSKDDIAKHPMLSAIRFYKSSNITIKGISVQNSPQIHLRFDNCQGVKVSNISVTSPRSIPNTNGIHLLNTRDADIDASHFSNGEDCISIQNGSANLDIHDVVCEVGHGISLGGLGHGQVEGCVSNVTIHDVTIKNSQNGVRIKAWEVKGKMCSTTNVLDEYLKNENS